MASPLCNIESLDFLSSSLPKRNPSSLLQQLSQKAALSGITAASRLAVRSAPEMASSGISNVDALTGGLPRGCLTEVCGLESSGRTSLMLAALAAATQREEVCTLIDASDAFDPHSAAAAGVDLERLLWVRCGSSTSSLSRRRRPSSSFEEWERQRMEDPVEQALRAADLLLQSSGFGMVVMDLASVPVKMARRIPLTTWFRFRRAVEKTPTVLLVLGTQPCAESCATLALKLSSQPPVVSRQETVLSSRFSVLSERSTSNDGGCLEDGRVKDESIPGENPSHAELLTGIEIQAEILRSRNERKPVQSASTFTTKTAWTA